MTKDREEEKGKKSEFWTAEMRASVRGDVQPAAEDRPDPVRQLAETGNSLCRQLSFSSVLFSSLYLFSFFSLLSALRTPLPDSCLSLSLLNMWTSFYRRRGIVDSV